MGLSRPLESQDKLTLRVLLYDIIWSTLLSEQDCGRFALMKQSGQVIEVHNPIF